LEKIKTKTYKDMVDIHDNLEVLQADEGGEDLAVVDGAGAVAEKGGVDSTALEELIEGEGVAMEDDFDHLLDLFLLAAVYHPVRIGVVGIQSMGMVDTSWGSHTAGTHGQDNIYGFHKSNFPARLVQAFIQSEDLPIFIGWIASIWRRRWWSRISRWTDSLMRRPMVRMMLSRMIGRILSWQILRGRTGLRLSGRCLMM
jgi:hypothetical protein